MSERILAIDVGGTRTKWAVITEERQLASQGVLATPRGDATTHAHHLLQLSATAPELPVAIAWPGPTNTGCEIDQLAEALLAVGLRPSVLVGDMVAAAVGESASQDIALLQIGSGVGGAVISAGRVQACVTGHLVFRVDGIPCATGMRGTVDAYLGFRALQRRALSLEPAPVFTDPSDVLRLASTHPGVACLLDDALAAAGFAAANLIACCSASRLVLAGGVAASWGQVLLRAARDGIDQRVYRQRAAEVEVVPSELRESAPLLGLAHLHDQRSASA